MARSSTGHVDEIFRSGALVQIVDVLRTEKVATGKLRFELGERDVRRIRIGFAALRAARGVESPDSGGIATPSIGRAHVLDAESGPQAV